MRLENPDGTVSEASIREGAARFGALLHTGVYRVMGPEGRQERVAVNLVSDSESDLSVRQATPVDAGGASVPSHAALGRAPRPVARRAAALRRVVGLAAPLPGVTLGR